MAGKKRESRASTNGIGLEAVGVETDGNGAIVVDKFSRTSVENIFAIGDVTNRMCLTPVALHEGMCLANYLFGGEGASPTAPCFTQVPSAVFSNPNIGTCGMTEAEAREQHGGSSVVVFKSCFRPMKHTISGRKGQKCLLKLIVHAESDNVLGCHMCGADAAEIMQGLAVAIKSGCTKATTSSE